MAANGISTLAIASGTTLTKNINPPHSNTEIVAPGSAIWSLNYVGALGATNDVSYKLYVTSLGIGSAITLTSHQTGDYAVTAGNFLYDEYGTSIGIIKGNTTINNYMAKAAAVCGSLSNTIITAATYKGTWNAFSDTPTLTDGVGTLGDAYSVTTSGTSGEYPEYVEQDWRIYDGATWIRVAKTTTTEWTIKPAVGGLADKEARQLAKLAIATAKRQGKTVAVDGTITGSLDDTKPYYRAANTLDINLLPTKYNGNGLTDNPNTGGLVAGRPWSSVPVSTGLVLSLDAGNPASYPGSGTTWTDTAGGKTFALSGSPTYSSNNGGYLSFNGSSQYAYASTSLSTLSTWTVESWYFYNSVASGQNSQIITEALNSPATAINYRLGRKASGAFVSAGYFAGAWRETTPYTLTNNTWNQIVGTYDGTNLKVYVNGALVQTNTGGLTLASGGAGILLMTEWTLGSPQGFLGGRLAIVNVYNQDIGLANIQSNYNTNLSRFA
jgi:hypothetical protein